MPKEAAWGACDTMLLTMAKREPPSEFIKATEIQHRLDVSLSTAYRLMADLGAVKSLGAWRLKRVLFERFVEALKAKGPAKRARLLMLKMERSAPAVSLVTTLRASRSRSRTAARTPRQGARAPRGPRTAGDAAVPPRSR